MGEGGEGGGGGGDRRRGEADDVADGTTRICHLPVPDIEFLAPGG